MASSNSSTDKWKYQVTIDCPDCTVSFKSDTLNHLISTKEGGGKKILQIQFNSTEANILPLGVHPSDGSSVDATSSSNHGGNTKRQVTTPAGDPGGEEGLYDDPRCDDYNEDLTEIGSLRSGGGNDRETGLHCVTCTCEGSINIPQVLEVEE